MPNSRAMDVLLRNGDWDLDGVMAWPFCRATPDVDILTERVACERRALQVDRSLSEWLEGGWSR